MIQNVRYIKPYTKRKQRGRSSLSIRYCIHGNRMQFDSHTIVTDKRPVVQGERSVEHPDHSGAQMALLGTQGAGDTVLCTPTPHVTTLSRMGKLWCSQITDRKVKELRWSSAKGEMVEQRQPML